MLAFQFTVAGQRWSIEINSGLCNRDAGFDFYGNEGEVLYIKKLANPISNDWLSNANYICVT